jgi:alpha-L-arabinofuranosidase
VPLRVAVESTDVDSLDVSATGSVDGSAVTVFVVNDGLEAVEAALDLTGLGTLSPVAEVWTLTDRDRAGEPDVTNGFGDPERIAPVASRAPLGDSRLEHAFEALSLTVLRFTGAQ